MTSRIFTTIFMAYFLICSCSTQASKPLQYELKLGRNIAAIILGKYEQSNNIPLIRYVNLVGQSITSTSGRKDIPFHFSVIESDAPNAIACPGGYIFITTGLLKIIKNEAELAGVLAHEIAHVNQKHVFNKVYKIPEESGHIFTRFLTAKNTSMSVAFSEVSHQALQLILDKGLDEDDKEEADIAAVFYLQNTGYRSQAYLDLLERVPDHHLSHSKTHPPMNQRISTLASIFPIPSLERGETLTKRYESHAVLN